MSKFMSSRFSELKEYTPGEQPIDKKYIKLNTNESPYPPAPGVIKAINENELNNLMLYSDPETKRLKEMISQKYNIGYEQIILGNGSDEILAFSFYAFSDVSKGVCFPDISYGFYEVYADLYGFPKDIVPLNENFDVVPSDYFNRNKTIFIANPNAPTGKVLSLSQIEEILKANSNNVVVIDEAYVDFGDESAVSLIDKYENLLVVQTFSKSRSLAGARLGMAIGNKELISDLNKIKFSFNPYNINRLTLLAGFEAMKDTEYFEKCTKKIIATREKTIALLKEMNFEVMPSKTNFIFAKNDKLSGEEIYRKLKDNGILVRHFKKDRIKDYVRITIGTDEQMTCLIKTLKNIL